MPPRKPAVKLELVHSVAQQSAAAPLSHDQVQDHAQTPFEQVFQAALRADRRIGELLEAAWNEVGDNSQEQLKISAFAMMAHDDPYRDVFDIKSWINRFNKIRENLPKDSSGAAIEIEFWIDAGVLAQQNVGAKSYKEHIDKCIKRAFNGIAPDANAWMYLCITCLAKSANNQQHATSQAFIEHILTHEWYENCSLVPKAHWLHYVGYMYFFVEDYDSALEYWQKSKVFIAQLESTFSSLLSRKEAMQSLLVLLGVAATRIAFERNQLTLVQTELDAIKSIARNCSTDARILYHHAKGRLALRIHKPIEAIHQLDVAREILKLENLDAGYSPVLLIEYLQALLALERWPEAENKALEFSNLLVRSKEYCDAIRYVAIAYQRYEERDASNEQTYLDALELALNYAQSHGMRMLLRSVPDVASWLCAQGLENDLHVEFIREVITARKLPVPKRAPRQWPWAVWLDLIGPFSIFVENQTMALTGKVAQKPLELIKLLACTKRFTLNAEQIVMQLWPDTDDFTAARKNLEMTISRARKLIGDAAIKVGEGRVQLDATLVGCDLQYLLDVCSDTESMQHKSVSTASIQRRAQELSSLYRGELLQADEESVWLSSARQYMCAAFIRATLALVHMSERTKESTAYIATLLEQAIAAEPLAEQLYLRLMRHYAKQGQSADALTTYRRCKQTLSVLAGLSPSAETEQVKAQLFL